jgi:hypothetical protein
MFVFCQVAVDCGGMASVMTKYKPLVSGFVTSSRNTLSAVLGIDDAGGW